MNATEDPAPHVFGLDSEDTKLRNQNMIDLRGAAFRRNAKPLWPRNQIFAGFPSSAFSTQEIISPYIAASTTMLKDSPRQ
jgi:hypothetical protein